MPALDQRVLVEHQGPRPDEAHLAAQHVDQLRQLVEQGARMPAPTRVTRGSPRA